MTFSPFNRQNQGQAQTSGVAPGHLVGNQTYAQQVAAAPTAPAAFGPPANPFAEINFGPQGKPDIPDGDHVLELIPGDATRDPGAETGRWFYAPPGDRQGVKLAFAFRIVESNRPELVGFECVRRQPMRVNSKGSDGIVYKKIGSILFALFGIARPSAEDKAQLGASWDEFVQRGTVGGQSLLGLKCRVRVYPGRNVGREGRPFPEYDFRPL